MKRLPFPWIALILGVLITMVLLQSGALDPGSERPLPLLTLLVFAEFGFFVTAIGAVLAARNMRYAGFTPVSLILALGCSALALGLLYLGISLWPGVKFYN